MSKYIIVNSIGQRARTWNSRKEIKPFVSKKQAWWFIKNRLANSPYMKVIKVRK